MNIKVYPFHLESWPFS